jgi:two-component system cell cycle sensor histidine kinase PleC
MTLGTSTRGGIATLTGTEHKGDGHPLLRAAGRIWRTPWLARGAATLHLLGLGLIVTLGWHDPSAAATGATIAGLPAVHLAFLMATGAAAAFLTLGAREGQSAPAIAEQPQPVAGADQLLAQMSHELRTPLNAMIGFSELMLRELYGPLGHSRYQEYAAHINESGGRLLKSSEDALAVTETMSAMMAERLGGRRERVLASSLARDAWTNTDAARSDAKLAMSNLTACDIVCERRATGQALQHLLREALARTPASGAVEVRGRRRGGARSIEIKVVNGSGVAEVCHNRPEGSLQGPDGSLRVILARLLLEMQGATLSLWDNGETGIWYACVAFPPPG